MDEMEMDFEDEAGKTDQFSWEREEGSTKAEFEERSQRRHELTKAARTKQVVALFNAYQNDRENVVHENALLQFIMLQLTGGARRAFRIVAVSGGKPGFGDWEDDADELASDVVLKIARKLSAGYFKDHDHLLGFMGMKIRFFRSAAFAAKKKSSIHQPLVNIVRDDNGLESEQEYLEAGAELPEHLQAPNEYVRPIHLAVRQCLTDTESYLIRLLELHGKYPGVAADTLGVTANTFAQKIKRLGDKIKTLQSLIESFRAEGESDRQLADRFMALVNHLSFKFAQQQPECFADAVTMASHQLLETGVERTATDKVVRHLLKLWRGHTEDHSGIVDVQGCAETGDFGCVLTDVCAAAHCTTISVGCATAPRDTASLGA